MFSFYFFFKSFTFHSLDELCDHFAYKLSFTRDSASVFSGRKHISLGIHRIFILNRCCEYFYTIFLKKSSDWAIEMFINMIFHGIHVVFSFKMAFFSRLHVLHASFAIKYLSSMQSQSVSIEWQHGDWHICVIPLCSLKPCKHSDSMIQICTQPPLSELCRQMDGCWDNSSDYTYRSIIRAKLDKKLKNSNNLCKVQKVKCIAMQIWQCAWWILYYRVLFG